MAYGTFNTKGLRELSIAFKALDGELQQKIARSATAAGAGIFKKAIARLAPVAPEPYKIEGLIVQPGNLARNVVVKRLKPGQTDATSEHLVVMRSKRRYGYAGRIGSLQEFGSVNMSPNPFFRPGADAAAEPAANAVRDRLAKGLKAAIKKLEKP